MATESSGRFLPQVLLLLLALSGWTAFAGAFFNIQRTHRETEKARALNDQMREVADQVVAEKDSTIRLLQNRIAELEARLGDPELFAP